MKCTLNHGTFPEISEAHVAKLDATTKHATLVRDATKVFSKLAVGSNLGRGAMVQHIHADAGAGKLMNIIVTSRVVNAYVNADGIPKLRVNVGKKDGTTGIYYGDLKLTHIIDIVEPSSQPFA